MTPHPSASCPPSAPSPQDDDAAPAIFSNALAEAHGTPAPGPDALDRAGVRLGFGGAQVDEVRMVLRMAPIFLLTILYWTIYSQMASVFVIQANYMDRRIPIGDAVWRCAARLAALPSHERL
jgi:POT family